MANELPVGTLVDHPAFGEGIIGKVNLTCYDIYFEVKGKVQISKTNTELEILDEPENIQSGSTGYGLKEIEELLSHVLDKYGALSEIIPIGDKWIGGTMTLQPANSDLKPKEIPIETFFHKIVMVRDRLRVLEQNINSNSKLNDEEKVNLQQYITRAYGSLTTFNVLFDNKDHYFSGQKIS